MAEVITPRLMAAAKEFNIGTQTLTDFLTSKGFDVDELKPTSKITGDMYLALQVEFQPDKVAKQKAEQIDLPKNAPPDNKKRRDEQDLSFTKKETAKPKEEIVAPKEEIPEPEPEPVEEIKAPPVEEPVPVVEEKPVEKPIEIIVEEKAPAPSPEEETHVEEVVVEVIQ
ncbi:MAG TPA: hypothetical protein VJ279_03620, partial [Hanamia sp.]|nr:hypothetical protein [Hanamia sp.]